MIDRTFQHVPGVGPWREKDLWARGIHRWSHFPPADGAVAISRAKDIQARDFIGRAQAALESKDLAGLARLIPQREHWRLYREFHDEAVFFDIETDGMAEQNVTVVSLLDRDGIQLFVRGRNLDKLPEALNRRAMWVTFNGSCFDVPVLRGQFPKLGKPAAHLDLRFIGRRIGWKGGLKGIEDQLGLSRPQHLRGVGGYDAVVLWQTYKQRGDLGALRLLCEYNLYDSVNLKSLMEEAYQRAAEALSWEVPHLPRFERGEVLYDISRLVLEV